MNVNLPISASSNSAIAMDVQKSSSEREQLELGRRLFSLAQTVPEIATGRSMQQSWDVQLRIISTDEHVARLPWPLLADESGIFLCTAGWSVALAGREPSGALELPPSPRILLVAPQPNGCPPTNAELHLNQLENKLSAHDARLTWGGNLRQARSWEQFQRELADFQPQVIYYYGHGDGDARRTRLLFASQPGNRLLEIPVADFALQLRQLAQPPLLAYVNCCSGDAGGLLGVGFQLRDFIPAVITNRSIVEMPTAQAQAMALWESVLLRGVDPMRAVALLYSRLGDLGLTTADARWITPVIHAHYAEWRANPPKPADRLVHDPHWHLKIDRVEQYSVVVAQTLQMLRERKPRCHAFVWYGRQGEGMEIFHERLRVELQETLGGLGRTHVVEIRPQWPMEFHNFHRSCQDMLTEAFGVNSLDDIPARVRSLTAGAAGVQALVYVRHEPVRSETKVLNAERLRSYVAWWDSQIAPLLEPQQFVLVGVSFQVQNPPAFNRVMDAIEDLELHDTVVRLLSQMERLAERDLRAFLKTHNIRIPLERQKLVLDQILERTQGRYEQTVEELRNLIDLAWAQSSQETETGQNAEEEDW